MKNYFIAFTCIIMLGVVSCSDDDPAEVTSYTITFDSDGGTAVPSQTVNAGETATAPANPSKEGHSFLFWHTSGSVDAYNFQTPVNSDITLIASWDKEKGLADIAAELGEDEDYSLFAAALANVSDNGENYTIFALPNSIIERDNLAETDIQWHVVRGNYSKEELMQKETLQTVGGQTLTVVNETAEIDGQEETLLYVNDVPLDYRSARILSGSVVYPIGTNIARISAVPDVDELDAYNNWAVLAIEGTWIVDHVEKRKYHVWSVSGREDTPFQSESVPLHNGCREVFVRNPEKVSQGCAGTYETTHRCNDEKLSYWGFTSHHNQGWWSVNASCIEFRREVWAGGPMVTDDKFIFSDGIRRIIKCASGYGGDGYYGGDEDVIFDTYYETEYTLRKMPDWK